MSTFKENTKTQKGEEISQELINRSESRLGNARAKLLLQQPFYGVLLSMTNFNCETAISTMATDGVKVYYNPEFVESLTDVELHGVLLHEISHCIYLHCSHKRRMSRDSKRWNVAADFAVNWEIRSMNYTLPKDVLLDDKYRDLNTEQIYDALPKDISKMETLDMHLDMASDEWDDMEDKIIAAYEATKDSKTRGTTPAGMKRWIDKLRKSKVRWERVFHRYVGQALAKDDYSYVRPNRRLIGQDIYVPDLRSYIIGNVVVAIDTSGSICEETLKQFSGELAKISGLVNEVTIMTCDAAIHEVVKIYKLENFLEKIKFKGGGGTSFIPVFEKIKELNLNPELLIYLTDLFGEFPNKKPTYPVLWCVTGSAEKAPFGECVYIPNDKNKYDIIIK